MSAEAGGYDNPGFLTSHLVSGGPPKDGIPALTNPNFVDPERIAYLREDDLVMGLVFDGDARAYPHNIGWWNEIINDQFTDRSVAVTLCPLTGTGLVFDATGADRMQIEFGGLANRSQIKRIRYASAVVYFDMDERTALEVGAYFAGRAQLSCGHAVDCCADSRRAHDRISQLMRIG